MAKKKSKKGLYENIQAKRKRIKAGSGEKMPKGKGTYGSKRGRPPKKNKKKSMKR